MKAKKTNNRKQIRKSVSKTTKRNTTNTDKTVQSVENGIKIVQYAIRKKTSLSKASDDNGRGRNYVSDIKARIENNYKNRSINRELYTTFKTTLKNYESQR